MENTNKTKDNTVTLSTLLYDVRRLNTINWNYFLTFLHSRNYEAYLLSSSSEDDESLKLNNRLFRPMKFIVQHEMT
ncbi:hypothetical protein T12_1443 [Trichinella patagoniensis]|uniref:Uncharacterized protein n=1 Tax=Trichinella patagoniensis TaxID=990121 RepID=A0A0V1AA61_9BILA|nr:hypothetical protein T12_1443 [Trichinella patagoniensis]